MGKTVLGLGFALLLGASFAMGFGCQATTDEKEKAGADDSAKEEPMKDPPGGGLARGVMGVSTSDPNEGSTPEEKAYTAIVNDLIAEIETQQPGRLAQIDADFKSRDPDKVPNAKRALDTVIAETIASASFKARVDKNRTLKRLSLSPRSLLLRPLDLVGSSGALVTDGGSLVDGGQQLLCEHPKGADGQPMRLGRGADGRFGDDRTGAGGAAGDVTDMVDTSDLLLWRNLEKIDSGQLRPDPDSRLGAYAATAGYPAGTVGASVHRAIGTIYISLANYGQEKIGRVFNSPEARALYNQPVASCAGAQMAMLEYQYWADVANEDGWSAGGRMGSMFNPTARNWLQTRVFAN